MEARANSRLVLLYSVEFSVLEQLEDAVEDEEDEEPEEPITVGYTAGELKSLLLRVRKGLNLYSRYVRYHNYIDEEDLFFTESGKKFDIDAYGIRFPTEPKSCLRYIFNLISGLSVRAPIFRVAEST